MPAPGPVQNVASNTPSVVPGSTVMLPSDTVETAQPALMPQSAAAPATHGRFPIGVLRCEEVPFQMPVGLSAAMKSSATSGEMYPTTCNVSQVVERWSRPTTFGGRRMSQVVPRVIVCSGRSAGSAQPTGPKE